MPSSAAQASDTVTDNGGGRDAPGVASGPLVPPGEEEITQQLQLQLQQHELEKQDTRRERERHFVPDVFRRSPFHPAQQALAVLALPEERRESTVAHLEHLRDELVHAVASAAPPWDDHVELAAKLNSALHVSHHAAGVLVAAQIGALSPAQKRMQDEKGQQYEPYEQQQQHEKLKNQQLQHNPDIGAGVDSVDSRFGSAKTMVHTLERIEFMDTKLKLLGEVRGLALLADVSEKAEDRAEKVSLVGKALAAADSPPLNQIEALATLRESLSRRAADMEAELAAEIANGIFCVVEDLAKPPAPSPPPAGQETMDASHTAYTRSCEAVMLLDTLRGAKSAARAIEDVADERIDALMVSVLELASSPLARSGYAAANRQADLDGDRTRRTELGARGRAGRPVCTKVFHDLEECVRRIMDRLVRLSIDVPEMKGQANAIAAVWRAVEQRISALARYVLDIHDREHLFFRPTEAALSADMLPPIQLVGGYDEDLNSVDRVPYNWNKLVAALPDIKPDIYNLAAIHCCMLRIASHGADAVTGLSERDDVIVLLEDAGKTLVNTVRRDVMRAAAPVLELRPIALLQAATLRDRVTISQHLGGHHPKLPLLPSIRDLAPVVADVLSLAPLVPTVSADLGGVLGEHIFAPFANRCVAALNLVSTWSDAGHVYDRVVVDNPSMTARDVINRASSNDRRCATLDAVVALYCDTFGTHPVEPMLFDEDQWKAMVQLVASVSALVYEVRLCAGEDMTGLAADVIPLVRFRPRLKGSHGASSGGTPISSSSMGSSTAARLTDAMLDSGQGGAGQFYGSKGVMHSSETTRPTGATASGTASPAKVGRASNTRGESGTTTTVPGADKRKTQKHSAAPERARGGTEGHAGGALPLRSSSGPGGHGGWGFASNQQSSLPLHGSGVAAMHSGDAMRAVSRAVSAAQGSILALEIGVVDRALVLLQADIMTRCYVRAFRALRAVLVVAASTVDGADSGAGIDGDGPEHGHDGSAAIQQFEYDEYGDPIVEDSGSDLTGGRAMDPSGPSSASNSSQHSGGGSTGSATEALRGLEVESLANGLTLGSELRWAHEWAKVSLGSARRRFVFGDADAAIASGLRAGYAGHSRDRVLAATAARAFARGVRSEGAGALRTGSRRSLSANPRGSDMTFRTTAAAGTETQ
jgi:hypothetical protein